MRWLKHAFAIERPDSVQPNEQQRAVIDQLCREIVRRRLTTPALMFLEMSRPLNYVGSQALHFFMPFISAVSDAQAPKHLAEFLEQRGSIDYICRQIEGVPTDAPQQAAAANQLPATEAAAEAQQRRAQQR